MDRYLRRGALWTLPVMLAALAFSPRPAFADAPGVARLSVVQGNVTVTRGDSQQTVAGVVNAPLTTSDYLSTGASTYAEVQFDGMSMLRVAGDTQVRFASMDPLNRQIQIAGGTAELALIRGNSAATTIDTPSISVRSSQMGDYRISVVPNGATWVTVRSGVASLITPHGTQTLYAGNTAIASGPATHPSVSFTTAPATDAFDAFNSTRNAVALAAYNASSQYLDPSIAGTTDFAQYGTWVNVAGYGNVWSPYQTAGWAPYRNGNWVWTSGVGWTWVGYEPWGWAPYHYGRWFWANGYGWCWYPPAFGVASAYVWQPALVGFIGFNFGGIGIGFGFGNVAWVPLAPFEPFYGGWGWNRWGWNNGWNGGWGRGWGRGGYGNVTYITNITNINNYYINAKHGGATAPSMRGGRMAGTRPFDPGGSRNVSVIRGPLPVVPTRKDLAYDGHFAQNPKPLSSAFSQPRFASTAQRVVPFSTQADRVKDLASQPAHVVASKNDPAPPRSAIPPQSARNDDRVAPESGTHVAPANDARTLSSTHAAQNVEGGKASTDPWSNFERSRSTEGAAASRETASNAPAESRQPTPVRETSPVTEGRGESVARTPSAWDAFDASRGTRAGVPTEHSVTYSPRYNDGAAEPRYNQGAPAERYDAGGQATRYGQTYAEPRYNQSYAAPRYGQTYSAPAPRYSGGGYQTGGGGYQAPRGAPQPSHASAPGGGRSGGGGGRGPGPHRP